MLSSIEITGNKDTRSGFGDGILEAARVNENIVALTADLAGSMKLNGFIKMTNGINNNSNFPTDLIEQVYNDIYDKIKNEDIPNNILHDKKIKHDRKKCNVCKSKIN